MGEFASGKLRGHGFGPDFERFAWQTLKERAEGISEVNSLKKELGTVSNLV